MSRLTRHEILKEDHFLIAVETVRDFYLKNQKKIFLTLGIAAALVLLVGGGSYYIAHQGQKAKDELSQALRIYHAPVVAVGTEPSMNVTSDLTFKTDSEKYQKALTEFQKVSNNYGSHPVGKIAKYYTALSLQALGKINEAIAVLEPLSRENSDYGILGSVALAQIYEANGNLSKATEVYRQIVERNSPLAPKNVSLMHLAQLYEQQNKTSDATKIYQQVVKDFPNSSYSSEAEQKLKQASR